MVLGGLQHVLEVGEFLDLPFQVGRCRLFSFLGFLSSNPGAIRFQLRSNLIGDLLIKVAENIEDQKIMKKEMAANVTTYVIFITFSSIIAAPFLFALSGALIQVMQSIAASLAATGASGATSTIGISFGGTGIEPSDFRIFAIVSLCISATMSAMVISMIKKGSVKEGANNIPVFLVVSLTLYFIANFMAGYLVGIFF